MRVEAYLSGRPGILPPHAPHGARAANVRAARAAGNRSPSDFIVS